MTIPKDITMTTDTTNKEAGALSERATFKEFRAALARFNDANTPVSIADRVMILSNATFLLDEYVRAIGATTPMPAAQKARYFVYDPENGLGTYDTDEKRAKAHAEAIEPYLYDGWSEEVEHVVSGVITHITLKRTIATNPEHGDCECSECEAYRDAGGTNEWSEICDYQAAPVAAPAAAPAEVQAEAVEVDEWQPIATAPRDGSNILIRFGSDGVSQAKYVPGTPHPWKFIDTNDGITWLINGARDDEYGPSHWMPMPSVHEPEPGDSAAAHPASGAEHD